MDEKKSTENIGTGDKPEGASKIERAEQAVKRMEDAEKRLDEKIARLQELEVNRLLGSTAGGHIEVMTAVETPKEYADKVMSNKIKAI